MSAPPIDPDAPAALGEPRYRALRALGWSLAGAICAGGSWGGSWYAVCAWLGVVFWLPGSGSDVAVSALMLAGVGIIYGGCAGAFVGIFRWRDRSGAFFLMCAGSLTAAFGYGLSVLAVALTRDSLSPILSSSLAMAGVGFVAGLCGYFTSHRSTPPPPDEPAYEEEDLAPGAKVEWLLREPKRPWRLPRPLARVLPVLAVAVGALIGAAFVSSLALFAVSLLGFAVAWVLYRQEQRLDALEHQSRAKRDS